MRILFDIFFFFRTVNSTMTAQSNCYVRLHGQTVVYYYFAKIIMHTRTRNGTHNDALGQRFFLFLFHLFSRKDGPVFSTTIWMLLHYLNLFQYRINILLLQYNFRDGSSLYLLSYIRKYLYTSVFTLCMPNTIHDRSESVFDCSEVSLLSVYKLNTTVVCLDF